MLALVAAAVVVSATPRPLPNADSGVFVPRLDQLASTAAVMERAGERSILMRPSTWFSEFHPLLFIDFTRAESLGPAGIKGSGSATVSMRGNARMTCLELSDPKAFESRARAKLESLGEIWEGKVKGLSAVGARAPDGELRAGYVRRGDVSCSVSGTREVQKLLEQAAQATSRPASDGRWKGLRGLSGAAFFVANQATVGLLGKGDELLIDGRVSRIPAPGLQSGRPTPYAGMQPQGLLAMQATVKKEQVPAAVGSVTSALAKLCKACPPDAVQGLQATIAKALTGNVALGVETLEIKGRLKTEADRYFAVKHGWLAELSDAAAAKPILQQVSALPGAAATEDGFRIPVEGGALWVGAFDRHLYVANAPAAAGALRTALPPKPTRAAHGVTFALDPTKTSRALSQISMFDVLGSKELAGLFAVSTELGPLLSVTDAVTGWADAAGAGGHRFGLSWRLRPVDAGKAR